MDGRLAVLFLAMSVSSGDYLADGFNIYSPLESNQLAISAGPTLFETEAGPWELHVTYLDKPLFDRFNLTYDASVTESGGVWAGVGLTRLLDYELAGTDIYAGFSFVPGLYFPADDPDIGSTLNFRAGVELGVRLDDRWRVGLAYDHRSHARLGGPYNPGLETLQLRVWRSLN